ncbi:MAG: lysophospholipid acyltransferase family protein [Solirubrobacteraceae bacterium]
MRQARKDAVLERAHARARRRGVLVALYAPVRLLLVPVLRLWFRLRVSGREDVPADGPAIIAPNHKSFMDAFFVGVATRRHVRYMAKTEIFRGPLAWLLVRLGAFPVRRGEADAEAMRTAQAILEQGGVVVIFPEGTRVEDPDALGAPHHGAGRLALDTGAPIVPAAISGTAHLWFGPIAKPRRVQVAFLPPIAIPVAATPDAVSEIVDRELWPAVQAEYGRLRARPGLILAGLAAIGLGGGLAARHRAAAKPRILGVVPPRRLRRRRRRLPDRLRRR